MSKEILAKIAAAKSTIEIYETASCTEDSKAALVAWNYCVSQWLRAESTYADCSRYMHAWEQTTDFAEAAHEACQRIVDELVIDEY